VQLVERLEGTMRKVEAEGGDPDQVDAVSEAYRDSHGGDLQSDIKAHAASAVRQGSSKGMRDVLNRLRRMVGKKARWKPSGVVPGEYGRTTFARWARAESEAKAPALNPSTTINCWEVVLLAAYKTARISWKWIHDLYSLRNVEVLWDELLVAMLTKGERSQYLGHVPGRYPYAGEIVFFNGAAHVALATGKVDARGRAQVISFWPPPDKPSDANTVDKVKTTTIEELKHYMRRAFGEGVVVELAKPPWG